MNIIFATIDFVENDGPTTGLPKYLYRTSLTLSKWGHRVFVVTCSNRTIHYQFHGIEVYRVRRPCIVKYGDQGKDVRAWSLTCASIVHDTIRSISEQYPIDIVQYCSIYGIAIKHDFLFPAVMRLSSYAKMWKIPGREEAQMMYADLERRAAGKCAGVFGPSYVVAKEFGKDINRQVDVIETPFVMEDDRINGLIYDSCFSGKRYLLFYGTLIEYKGLDVIADIMRELLTAYPDICFGIIGDGDISFVDKIRKAAGDNAERVIYHSAIDFASLKPIISHAEGILLPSLMENFSNACVESMALGKIVIGTNGVSFEQLITDGTNGFLCEPGNPDSLFHAIQKLLSLKPEEKRRMEENAIIRTNDLAPEVVLRKLEQYYMQIIHNEGI